MNVRLMHIALAVFSAVLLSIALPNPLLPIGAGIFGFFSLAPLFIAIYCAPSSRWAILYGFIFGLINSLLSNFWLFFYKGFGWVTLGAASLGVGLLCMSVCAYIFVLRKQRSYCRPLLVCMAWAIYEIGKSNGFLGFPWGLIAYAPYQWPLFTQILDLTGVVGLSFLMSLCNAVIAEALIAWPVFPWPACQAHLKLLGALLAFTFFYSAAHLLFPGKKDRLVNMLLIQQNNDPWNLNDNSLELYQQTVEQALENHYQTFDLIVGSEGILPYPYQQNLMYYDTLLSNEESFSAFVNKIQMLQLVGSPLENKEGEQNGVVLLSTTGDVVGSYAKRQMVPFAEYNPLLKNPLGYWFFDTVVGYPFSWVPGTSNHIFHIPGNDGKEISFGVPICYEDAFGWVGRAFTLAGSDIFVNVTNDSWSKTVSAETQHLMAALYRTIENRRPMVRATTSGITSYIDTHGRIASSLPPFVRGSLSVQVPLASKQGFTLYTLAGEWLTWTFILFLHGYLIWYHYVLYGERSWRSLGLFRRALYDAGPFEESQYLTDVLQKYD